jgi:hypothetical protein
VHLNEIKDFSFVNLWKKQSSRYYAYDEQIIWF